jgi:hypothetical protein
VLAEDLYKPKEIDIRDTFTDCSFTPKKGGAVGGNTKRGISIKIMAVAEEIGLPFAYRKRQHQKWHFKAGTKAHDWR